MKDVIKSPLPSTPLTRLTHHVSEFVMSVTEDWNLPKNAFDRAYDQSPEEAQILFDALCADVLRLVDTRLELGLVPGKETPMV